MNDALQYAIQQEMLALFKVSKATIILHDDFKESNWPTYMMPLVLISIEPGDLSQQLLGGVTMEDWTISFSVYNHRPDISGMNPTNHSAQTTKIWDVVRRHFSTFSTFLTKEMIAVQIKYGFKWTYLGKTSAVGLEHPDGLCMGKAYNFGVVGLDEDTSGFGTGPTFDPDTNLIQGAPLPAGALPIAETHQILPSPPVDPSAPYSPANY